MPTVFSHAGWLTVYNYPSTGNFFTFFFLSKAFVDHAICYCASFRKYVHQNATKAKNSQNAANDIRSLFFFNKILMKSDLHFCQK